ncbi:hypothetical protein NPX13_g5608 [Xylaria arbuscula]|uniref:Uncharacterized protein n=1 Tax=Xylaria arbuscula TaxID=114810 RepID=A0A9W8NEI2_9PEZI|nr:hypothetical protein NPX13_g5608 [Xylaria arbuscula]
MAAQAEENFFLGPEFWADIEALSSDPIEHNSAPCATPSTVPSTNVYSLDHISANNNINNLLIMICARLDRVELGMKAIDETTREMKATNSKAHNMLDQVSRMVVQIQQTVNKLREDLEVFSRTVIHYLKLVIGQAEDRPRYSRDPVPMDELEASIAKMLMNKKSGPLQCDKPLPVLPVFSATPPLPLSQRRMLQPVPVPVSRGGERSSSWSEDQIKALRGENNGLREQVRKHRRRESADRQTIEFLAQQNDYYLREIERQDQTIADMAECVTAVFEEFKRRGWSDLGKRCSAANSNIEVDEMIRMYYDL